MRVGGATSQLDLPSFTPLFVAGCGRLQLGASHRAASVHYCKQLIIEPTFCGSRFSTGRLLAMEDFTFTFLQALVHWCAYASCFIVLVQTSTISLAWVSGWTVTDYLFAAGWRLFKHLLLSATESGAVHCSLFTIHCSVFTVHCSVFTVQCSLFSVHCSVFISLFNFTVVRINFI